MYQVVDDHDITKGADGLPCQLIVVPAGRILVQRRNPVGNGRLLHRCLAESWPADETIIPQPKVGLEIITLYVLPVGLFESSYGLFVRDALRPCIGGQKRAEQQC